jgi:hypothetical protein
VSEARKPAARSAEVVLVTYSADRDITALRHELSAAGIRSHLWLYDGRDEDFAVEAAPGCFRLRNGQRVLATEDLAQARLAIHRTGLGYWARPVSASSGSRGERAFVEREWASLLHGLLLEAERRHSNLTWVNPPSVSAAAGDKYDLLATADLDGLVVPAFRVSTDSRLPVSASGQFVCKAVGEDESVDETSTYCTALLDAETQSAIPFRTDCPSLIQERVLADHELRVYHLLGETIGLRISVEERDYVDLRLVSREHLSVDVVDVELGLRRLVHGYCERRSLAYCVFDFLRTAGGRYLLVDVTPSGTWSHFESPAERPVTRWYVETICRFLGQPPER